QGPLDALTTHPEALLRVRADDPDTLAAALDRLGAGVERAGPDSLVVTGVAGEDVGRAALDARVVLSELVTERSDLEQTFLELTRPAEEGEPAEPGGQSPPTRPAEPGGQSPPTRATEHPPRVRTAEGAR
ncbi:MAG: hypothetical protein ACRDN9_13460, partial [Streptosporangiaceae bacterium]